MSSSSIRADSSRDRLREGFVKMGVVAVVGVHDDRWAVPVRLEDEASVRFEGSVVTVDDEVKDGKGD